MEGITVQHYTIQGQLLENALTSNTSTSIDLRGLVLPGHRTFRKSIGAYAGEQKGLNVSASMKLRENPSSMVEFQAMHMHMYSMSELRNIEKEFGVPATVPDEDFTLFLQRKRRMLDDMYSQALTGVASAAVNLLSEEPGTAAYRDYAMKAAQAAGTLDARSYALKQFYEIFSDTMTRIAELEGF